MPPNEVSYSMTKSIFDHVKAIYEDQSINYFDSLEDADKKTVQTYMINRIVSMNPNYVHIVNEAQKYGNLDPRITYLFFSQCLPKGKRFDRYVKGVKEAKHEDWVVALVAKHFEVSKAEARDYLDIYMRTDDGKNELRLLCEAYAVDPKQIKKLKL